MCARARTYVHVYTHSCVCTSFLRGRGKRCPHWCFLGRVVAGQGERALFIANGTASFAFLVFAEYQLGSLQQENNFCSKFGRGYRGGFDFLKPAHDQSPWHLSHLLFLSFNNMLGTGRPLISCSLLPGTRPTGLPGSGHLPLDSSLKPAQHLALVCPACYCATVSFVYPLS